MDAVHLIFIIDATGRNITCLQLLPYISLESKKTGLNRPCTVLLFQRKFMNISNNNA